jgi:hypothetical protein
MVSANWESIRAIWARARWISERRAVDFLLAAGGLDGVGLPHLDDWRGRAIHLRGGVFNGFTARSRFSTSPACSLTCRKLASALSK